MSGSISTIPVLAACLGGFWLSAALAARRQAKVGGAGLGTVVFWLGLLGAWGALMAELATSGAFQREAFFAVLPGFWVPMIPITASIGLLLVLPAFRDALLMIATHVPARAFVLVHALRMAAAGGVAKGLTGALPASFTLPVGIPDFLFGVSALMLGLSWPREGLAPRKLIVWNLIGIAVILPAPVLMQMGLPGPLYTFDSTPDARALFEFPMALAPTLIVPLFIFTNGVHAAALWVQARRGMPSATGVCARSI